ncbi:ubiquitin-specific protease doa4 [Pleosporales sp. CAS-2024a]
MNGLSHGAPGVAGSDPAHGVPGTTTTTPPRGGAHPPMAAIVASAAQTVAALQQHSIRHLVDAARTHFQAALLMLATRSPPAGAYWEYLVAYQIVVDLVPRHRDYLDHMQRRSHAHAAFRALLKDITAHEERFVRIKDTIKNDHLRNGPAAAPGDDGLLLPAAPTAPLRPAKPAVQPQPHGLHGRAVRQSVSSVNGAADLAARFANLRGLDTAAARSSHPLSATMPSPAASHHHASSRPRGPRDMPPPPLAMPPLNTQVATCMPKEPSPTYSPARNISNPSDINPPRSTPRSMNGTGGRSNSIAASSASNHAPNANGVSGSYFPAAQPSREPSSRTRSVSKTVELEIDAEKLYDYIRMYKVLLIDVRDRAAYDAGHIYAHHIMCIEPETLQEGNSADQLHDRLVISPDEEVAMFDRRNEYDVIVYYDENTSNADFLARQARTPSETALKCLYTTLHEFNVEKPLRRPPVFLKGGLDAWVDIVGTQALKMSSTSALVASGPTRANAIRRSPAATHVAKTQRRSRREYVPMDEEEEQQWLEEARKGRAVVEQPDAAEDHEEPPSPFYRTTEDFLRRYPEIETEQSMMYPLSRPPSANHYVQPAIPVAPSRPAPAVPRMSYSGVHERQLAPQGRGNQPPVYLSQPRFTNVRMHKTGLLNFGVTCYMNSVVQCLSGHLLLSDLFLSQRYQRDLQRDNWKGTKGILPEAYATLVSNLFKGDVSSVRPSTFRRICGHFNSQWAIDQQQDAKEFLEFVLDYMHEDMNVTWNKAPLKALTEAQELQREQFPRQYAAKIEWGRYQHRDMSLIGGMFAGQHASQLTCQTCRHTSTTYEAFWSLSLEIPAVESCNLRDCLTSYCSAERLAGDELWRCPACKKDREAVKKITITRAPDTLVIHFKRFSASRTESARKIRTPVHFPLQSLDMAPFIEPPMTAAEESFIVANSRDGPAQLAGIKADPTMNGPFMYNAYAVIWHIGATLGSGHYVAFVKDKAKGTWRSFNDDKISDFDPGRLAERDRLQNEKAYIVFYERERVASGAF